MRILYPSAADPATLEVIEPDATTADGWTSSVTITENPIERSAPAADAVSPNADTLKAEIVLARSPVRVVGDHTGGVTGGVRRADLGNGQATDVLQFSSALQRPDLIVEELLRLQAAGTPLTVEIGERVFTEVAIKAVSRSRASADGDAVTLALEFQRLRIVEVASVPEPVIPQARAARSRGNQRPETPAPSAAEDNRSLLSRLTGFGRRVPQ